MILQKRFQCWCPNNTALRKWRQNGEIIIKWSTKWSSMVVMHVKCIIEYSVNRNEIIKIMHKMKWMKVNRTQMFDSCVDHDSRLKNLELRCQWSRANDGSSPKDNPFLLFRKSLDLIPIRLSQTCYMSVDTDDSASVPNQKSN